MDGWIDSSSLSRSISPIDISLRSNSSDIDEDVRSIRQFSSEMVLQAVLLSLQVIEPNKEHPSSLPRNMSARVSVCADIAQNIKDLGYRDDLGYHQLLYPNENDTRRLLSWLTNILPREAESSTESSTGASGMFV